MSSSRADKRSEAAARYRKLYKDPRWRHPVTGRRATQLRAHPWCAFCASAGRRTAATIADHVKPHRGDELLFFTGRLQSLCKPHHDGEKQRRERARRQGCDATGRPTAASHPWQSATISPLDALRQRNERRRSQSS